ncbi:MAG: hypothetical protein DA407_06740 [Bacteroidetes bacterium]|nr:MAG: hypothetical protein DA407_06740 [Bacteroidota bacterium]
MKKSILIIFAGVITLGLTAFGIMQSNNSEVNELSESNTIVMSTTADNKIADKIFTDFIYDVGPRFSPIKKTDLDKITSFNDIIGEEHANRIVEYKWVTVVLIIDDKESNVREFGTSDVLTEAQLNLLHSFDYSTNLMIAADYQGKNKETGVLEDTHWTPYLTIVPEKQAEYSEGQDALKVYLKESSKDSRDRANVDPEKLQPAKLYFTVTKNGTIENIKLDRTSNYPLVDYTMIELITKLPGTWIPAENHEGEKVDQELVVSFGLMGC